MPDNITIFSKQIALYGVFINIGTVAGLIVFLILAYKKSKSIERVFGATVLAFALLKWGFFASNIVRGLNYNSFGNIAEMFTVNAGGHFIGRVLLVMAAFPVLYILLFQKFKYEWKDYLDIFCFYLVIQHIFNRIACIFNGCCQGKSVSFLNNGLPARGFEVLSMIILLLVCIKLYIAKKHIFGIFGMWFAMTIFISEFMMKNLDVVYFIGIDAVQYVAIILFIISFVNQKGMHRNS